MKLSSTLTAGSYESKKLTLSFAMIAFCKSEYYMKKVLNVVCNLNEPAEVWWKFN